MPLRLPKRALVSAIAASIACGPSDEEVPALEGVRAGGDPAAAYRVLAFSRTLGFRHPAIPDARDALDCLGRENAFAVDATEEASVFTDETLARYRVVAFVLTTGDVLDEAQQGALERWVRAGGGWVGIHSASDTEYAWPWYAGLVGAYVSRHPPGEHEALVRVEESAHPSTAEIPATFRFVDEWYDFAKNPRESVSVLLTVDETTYAGGGMGADHPIAWYRPYDGGKSFYTALGHGKARWSEPLFLRHVLGGIRWAAGTAR